MAEMQTSSTHNNDAIIECIQAVLEELRPTILQDGGDIHFVRFDENGTVFVQLQGACVSCPISFITLKMGVEARLKEKVPGVKAVALAEEE